MNLWLLCTLLTASQPKAVCWWIRPDQDCQHEQIRWIERAIDWNARNLTGPPKSLAKCFAPEQVTPSVLRNAVIVSAGDAE